MMKNLTSKNYKCKNIDYDFLTSKGCRYYVTEDIYTYTFPLEKSKLFKSPLNCTITIQSDGDVRIDVTTDQDAFYSQFYNHTNSGYDEYLGRVNKKIENVLKVLNIHEKKTAKKENKKIGK